MWARAAVHRLFRLAGLEVRRTHRKAGSVDYPIDFGPDEIALDRRVRPFTMTPPEKVSAVAKAVEYVVGAGVPGAVVECGVWRGGCSMAAALTLIKLGNADRHLWLFDTFEGMTRPVEADVDYLGRPALVDFERWKTGEHSSVWCQASLDDVVANMGSTGYPADRIHCVRGRVEETIPLQAPDEIALLRLDTDWYESTRHELEHLFPRVVSGGVVILDDYGYWLGARKAVDEYFAARGIRALLHRTDPSGRTMVKA